MGTKFVTGASPPKLGVPATAVVSGSILSGAMMSLSAFVIPVFLDTNDDANQMLRQWVRLYHYGHIYLPALCIGTCGLYGYASLSKRAANCNQWRWYALAATLTLSMVPFTWLIMAPTNDTLFRLEASELFTELSLVQDLIVKWAWLHVTRSLCPLFGAFLGFRILLQELRTQPS